jgi:hypothetical protein
MNSIDKPGVVHAQIDERRCRNVGILRRVFASILELRSPSIERIAAFYLQPLSDQPRYDLGSDRSEPGNTCRLRLPSENLAVIQILTKRAQL